MKSFLGLLLFIMLFSCHDGGKGDAVVLDLNDAEERLEYSFFADSVSYLTLRLDENEYIGNIERLYHRDGFYYIWGSHRSGIFVFDDTGKQYSHIDAYGEGPNDFRDISSFSVVLSTGDVCILDYASQKLKFYGKDGRFQYSEPCPHWSVDLCVPDSEHKIFISPFYAGDENPSGVWVGDSNNIPINHLIDDVTPDHQFYYYPMTYNIGDSCLYYYDRNWDNFFAITKRDAHVLHRFEVKQKIPLSIMRDIMQNPLKLDGYAICDRFAYSHSKTLMLYCLFNYEGNKDERSYVWVVMDSRNKQVRLAHKLYNDLDHVQIDNDELFYIDEMTWARVCDGEADDLDIRIQLLHLYD